MNADIARMMLAALLDAAPEGVPVLMSSEDDPVEDGAFIRLHPAVEGTRTSSSVRAVMIRVGVQVPAAALDTDGHALAGLADTIRDALLGTRMTTDTHTLILSDGAVAVRSSDPSLRMQDAQIDFRGWAARLE